MGVSSQREFKSSPLVKEGKFKQNEELETDLATFTAQMFSCWFELLLVNSPKSSLTLII